MNLVIYNGESWIILEKRMMEMTTTHYLNPDPNTLHGFFDRTLQPALEINSGDSVI